MSASMTIWKFPLSGPWDLHRIKMPQGAKVLNAQYQGNIVTLWAEVASNNPLEERTFAVVGTGWSVPPEAPHYIGTVQEAVTYVWHVYGDRP